MRKLLVFLVLFYFFVSCKSYSDKEIASFEEQIETYTEKNNLQYNKLESGLYYRIETQTDSAEFIKYTDQVTFYYKGEILNGETFQVIPENDPLTFKVNELIAGWQEGLMQLKGKGTIKLIIPPHLGYGSKNTKKIPPNSILLYDLTVLNVE